MTPNGLPGICRGCGNPVVYTMRHWRNPAHLGLHDCRRPRCSAWMPIAKERCARAPGHRDVHKTRWAMDNQLDLSAAGVRKAHA